MPADFSATLQQAGLQWASKTSKGEVFAVAKVFTIPVLPDPTRRKGKKRTQDPRYIEGQRLLLEAMKYLMQQDPETNKPAVRLLSEHFRTRFRMSDRPGEVITPPLPK
jgi:hypothetical protein